MSIGGSILKVLRKCYAIAGDRVLQAQVFRFLLSGGAAVFTDFSVYYALLVVMENSPAKAISFICGAVVAYVLNKYYTFGKKKLCPYEMWRFSLLYFVTFFVNVFANKLTLFVFPQFTFLAFCAATTLSTVCNFIGQKFFVFARHSVEPSE